MKRTEPKDLEAMVKLIALVEVIKTDWTEFSAALARFGYVPEMPAPKKKAKKDAS